jgi:hypothetical protein
MVLDLGSCVFLNIGLSQALDVGTCHYRQQHVAANGNHASRIS